MLPSTSPASSPSRSHSPATHCHHPNNPPPAPLSVNPSHPGSPLLDNAAAAGASHSPIQPPPPPGPSQQFRRDLSSSGSRSRSRPRPSAICKLCGDALPGQFVRALGHNYHLDCLKCSDCNGNVSSRFFPFHDETTHESVPLCERDYFRRYDLLCHSCGEALRGSYVTALNRKYHLEHFACCVCAMVFTPQDSYYENGDNIYCHYHYSTRYAQRCHGCHVEILKQFVEIFRNGQDQHWHPECYMIHKFWNVRLGSSSKLAPRSTSEDKLLLDQQPPSQTNPDTAEAPSPSIRTHPVIFPQSEVPSPDMVTEAERKAVSLRQDSMESKSHKIWETLSAFEESSASLISDMLLDVSNGAFLDGVVVAKKFIHHVDVLFRAIDTLANASKKANIKEISYHRESKLLCKKIVSFFGLLSKAQSADVRSGASPQVLKLVTALAHFLKLLIRIGLQGALRYEREVGTSDEIFSFLLTVRNVPRESDVDPQVIFSNIADPSHSWSDRCTFCRSSVEDECIVLRDGQRRWHSNPPHLICSVCNRVLTQDLPSARWSESNERLFCLDCAHSNVLLTAQGGFSYVTRLQQYVYLLYVSLARLAQVLRSQGSLRTSESASRSTSSLHETVGEIKRMHSKRTERTLSTTFKRPRASRIVDGPEASSALPSGGESPAQNGMGLTHSPTGGVRVVDEGGYDSAPDYNDAYNGGAVFGNHDTLTLDDISRIAAAENAKTDRANQQTSRNLPQTSAQSEPQTSTPDQGSQPRIKYFYQLSSFERLIVNHLAVISVEPYLGQHFTPEEFAALTESRKPQNGIWNIFGWAFKNGPNKANRKKGVFGISLEALVEKDGTESTHGVGPWSLRIPTFIDDVVSAMRQMDMSVEGLFRKNGNIKRLKETAETIDTRYDSVDLNRETPIQVAALLKKFLREMPEPLLTFRLYPFFLAAQRVELSVPQRRHLFHLIICMLPKAHRDTMEVLFAFLNWAASFSQMDDETGNKMDIQNLARVITPGVLSCDQSKMANTTPTPANTGGSGFAPVDEGLLAIEVVTTLIESVDTMCEIPREIESMLASMPPFKEPPGEIPSKEILKRCEQIARPLQVQLPPPNDSSQAAATPTTTTTTAGAHPDPTAAKSASHTVLSSARDPEKHQ